MKKIALTIVVLCCAYNGFAQDTIATHDGKFIQAKILELTNEKVSYKKYDYQDGATIVLDLDKVKSISWANGDVDEFVKKENVQTIQKELLKTKGYEPLLEIGGWGQVEKDVPLSARLKTFDIVFVSMYRFNQLISIGGGIGFDYSFWKWEGYMVDYYGNRYQDEVKVINSYNIPLFARVKLNFIKQRVSPYILIDAGYSFVLNEKNFYAKNIYDEYQMIYAAYYSKLTGFLFSPCIGVDFSFNNNTKLYFHLGYHFHKNDNPSYTIHSIGGRIGFKF